VLELCCILYVTGFSIIFILWLPVSLALAGTRQTCPQRERIENVYAPFTYSYNGKLSFSPVMSTTILSRIENVYAPFTYSYNGKLSFSPVNYTILSRIENVYAPFTYSYNGKLSFSPVNYTILSRIENVYAPFTYSYNGNCPLAQLTIQFYQE
jgi:YHS domain-containing protein